MLAENGIEYLVRLNGLVSAPWKEIEHIFRRITKFHIFYWRLKACYKLKIKRVLIFEVFKQANKKPAYLEFYRTKITILKRYKKRPWLASN